MVKLEEVEDDTYTSSQPGPADDEEAWDTDDSGTYIPPSRPHARTCENVD